jgi:2-iminobutanoate/2-iminopropanoate deaminase
MLKLLITSVVFLAISTGLAQCADKKMILPQGAPPNAGWSYGILTDGTLYVSGMAGEDAAGKIPASFEDEMKQAFDNIRAVLKEADMSTSDVVSVQVYLTDAALFSRMNTVYKTQFKDPKPARTTVVVGRLVGEGHVEITVTAKK